MYFFIKALHIIFMVTWFAGLFYLPRLFVYHANSHDVVSIDRFKTMERKLYLGIMFPSMVLTVLSGFVLIMFQGVDWLLQTRWIHLKLCIVTLLIMYHFYLGSLSRTFERNGNKHSHVFYRWINELPVVGLISAVMLAILKPWT
jgi:putative membrane protein